MLWSLSVGNLVSRYESVSWRYKVTNSKACNLTTNVWQFILLILVCIIEATFFRGHVNMCNDNTVTVFEVMPEIRSERSNKRTEWGLSTYAVVARFMCFSELLRYPGNTQQSETSQPNTVDSVFFFMFAKYLSLKWKLKNEPCWNIFFCLTLDCVSKIKFRSVILVALWKLNFAKV